MNCSRHHYNTTIGRSHGLNSERGVVREGVREEEREKVEERTSLLCLRSKVSKGFGGAVARVYLIYAF